MYVIDFMYYMNGSSRESVIQRTHVHSRFNKPGNVFHNIVQEISTLASL